MKHLYFSLLVCLCCINQLFAADMKISANDRDELTVPTDSVDSFWIDTRLSHDVSDYELKYKDTIRINDGYYLVGYYRNNVREYVKEDLETFGDVFFDKVTFEYYANGTKASECSFLNDDLWYKFNYWSFASYSDEPWRESKDITAYKIKMSDDCYAIALRGTRDSIDPPCLTIFLLDKGKARLVYNKNVEINAISSSPSRTTFEVQTIKYDNNDKLIPDNYTIIFEKTGITIK